MVSRILTGALLLTLALLLTTAVTARAGRYHVYSCRTPAGHVAPVDGWSAPAHSSLDTTVNSCEAGGGLVAGLDDGYVHAATTDRATWAFNAPTGATLAGATLWRAGETVGSTNPESSGYYTFWLAGVANTGPTAKVFEECEIKRCPNKGDFANPLAPNNHVVVPANALESPYLSLNVSCGEFVNPCAIETGSQRGYAALIELFAADLTLSQSANPTVSSVAGGLANATTVSGTSDIAFDATDPGAGIYKVMFQVDGQVVSGPVPDEAGGRCRDVGETADGLPAFLYVRPCPASLSVDVPFDTTGLSNGVHHLVVNVLDAAGNATRVLDRQIAVANSVSAGRGAANGQNPSERATLTARWKGSTNARLNGGYGAAHTVEGRLADSEGHGIAGAQVEVVVQPAYTGAHARPLPPPRTTSDGRWSLRLPRGTSSCQLRIAYRSHLGDPTPVATRTLALSVRAALKLRVTPRVANAGGTIVFSGRLLGGPIPAGGKQLVLGARAPGGRWLEFHVIRAAHRGGRFRYSYRFHLAGPVTYQFRVRSEGEADFPYAAGSSNVVRVFER